MGIIRFCRHPSIFSTDYATIYMPRNALLLALLRSFSFLRS
jgi:hypothetical protein